MEACYECGTPNPSDRLDPDTGVCVDCVLSPTLIREAARRAVILDSPTERGVRWGRYLVIGVSEGSQADADPDGDADQREERDLVIDAEWRRTD